MARQFVYHMEGLSKTYPGNRKVLENINLSFYPDAKIGVLGVNGAGKSTLLRIMAGLDKEFSGEAWAAQGAPSAGGRGGGAECSHAILVVDDESTVRDFIAAVLRKQGYRVLTAADGREALALWEREKSEIEVLVVDVIMPVMDGCKFLREVKKARQDIKVMLTSGYSESAVRGLCAAYPDAIFLPKPYTARQVVEAMERILRQPGLPAPEPV